jgi:hypothetical protein
MKHWNNVRGKTVHHNAKVCAEDNLKCKELSWLNCRRISIRREEHRKTDAGELWNCLCVYSNTYRSSQNELLNDAVWTAEVIKRWWDGKRSYQLSAPLALSSRETPLLHAMCSSTVPWVYRTVHSWTKLNPIPKRRCWVRDVRPRLRSAAT